MYVHTYSRCVRQGGVRREGGGRGWMDPLPCLPPLSPPTFPKHPTPKKEVKTSVKILTTPPATPSPAARRAHARHLFTTCLA